MTAMQARKAIVVLAVVAALVGVPRLAAQSPPVRIARLSPPTDSTEQYLPPPSPEALPISLPAALQLANVRPLDIQLAQDRVQLAVANLQKAELLWLPNIYLGADYFRHDGQLQDVVGAIFGTSKSSLMVGAGPTMVFATTDAIFAPLAARQELRAREAMKQAVQNDVLLAVAEAYFNVQHARGDFGGAEVTLKHAEELVRRADQLAPGLVPPVEAVRARTELARRKQAVSAARERWRLASAELCRLLRIETTLPLQPIEPAFLQVDLIRIDLPIDELIPVALMNRPELASQQALVQATLQRIKQEKLRPLMPSILLRGTSTNPAGTLAGGYFGGGINDHMHKFSGRSDFDLQVVWELQNLGFGNRASVNAKKSEHSAALTELFRWQDRIAAEVIQAHAQVQEALVRMADAQLGLKLAAESVQKNFDGLNQTKRLGADVVLLVIRPQEVIAAIQALAQANFDFYAAIADYDRGQFRLYRALGHPAQAIEQHNTIPCTPPP